MGAIRITLALPEDLLAVVDRYIDEHAGATRSGVCAEALRDWLRAKQEAEIAAYYLTQTDEERAEDAAWTPTAAESAHAFWR